jgi:WD40 repeat protein
VTGLAIAPGNNLLVSAGTSLHVWNLTTGKLLRRAEVGPVQELDPLPWSFDQKKLAQPEAYGLTFAPSGRHLTGLTVHQVITWDVTTLRRCWSVDAFNTSAPRYSPDGRYLAVRHDSNRIRLVDAGSGRPVQPRRDAATIGRPIAFLSDRTRLVAEARWNNWDVWDWTRGRRVQGPRTRAHRAVL